MMQQQRRITQAYFNLAYSQYAPLIQKLAFRISIKATQVEELKAQAMEELLKCMICYSHGGSFITFFHGRLAGIFRHMRDTEQRAMRVQSMSLDSMMNIAGPDYNMDAYMIIQECLECLDDDERNIIIELFFGEKTMREISSGCKMVPSTICRIKARAINKMKQRCGVELE